MKYKALIDTSSDVDGKRLFKNDIFVVDSVAIFRMRSIVNISLIDKNPLMKIKGKKWKMEAVHNEKGKEIAKIKKYEQIEVKDERPRLEFLTLNILDKFCKKV